MAGLGFMFVNERCDTDTHGTWCQYTGKAGGEVCKKPDSLLPFKTVPKPQSPVQSRIQSAGSKSSKAVPKVGHQSLLRFLGMFEMCDGKAAWWGGFLSL
jgi:hypothetical protein